jgi:DNA-binding response OmpR family regulator
VNRILVIEDHKKLLRSLQRGLSTSGYDVVPAETGEAGFYCASTEQFDLIVLDLMLPGRDGLEVLRDLRRLGCSAPVLILSARDSVDDRVRGLDVGADDYLVKPFAFDELLARIRAHLKRSQSSSPVPPTLRVDDLELQTATHEVFRGGRKIELTRQEYGLLEYLVRHRNTVVSRAVIARDVWKEPQGMTTNGVDVCVNALRKKIEGPGLKKLIHTVRGIGYTISDDLNRVERHRVAESN